MRELTFEEINTVSGGACADTGDLLWATFSGALGGALSGARGGALGAVAGAVYFGAVSGATYLAAHDGPCMSE
ncbi:MAG: hypothetical protein WDZ76_06815 [Pseudohongiellaceae bacterium]